MQNARLNEAQTGIKVAGRNINNLKYADEITLMAEGKEELKSLLMKEESGKSYKLYLFIILAPKSLQMVTAAMKLKDAWSLEEKL